MKRNIVIPGLLGGLVAFVWLFLSNALIPLKSDLIHQVFPNQLEVHTVLKEHLSEPGTYLIPYVPLEQEASFPDYRQQPVYSITYSGYSHGQTGSVADIVVPISIIFLVAFLASWMLSVTSVTVRSSYWKKVLFVTIIGVVIALHEDILQLYFGPQLEEYLLFMAINNVLVWFWMGLVIAWKAKPNEG